MKVFLSYQIQCILEDPGGILAAVSWVGRNGAAKVFKHALVQEPLGTLPVLGNFRRADSPDLTDCPGVFEDGFNVNQLTVRMSHDILCYAN